ncbi:MAG: hypothetical protein ACRYFZ_00770 [Janthinobacterium lividum]
MKNLLAFTALFAAGFLLGSRRAAKPTQVEFRLRAADLVASIQQQNYRVRVTEKPALCRADLLANDACVLTTEEYMRLKARRDAGERLTDSDFAAFYKHQRTA